MPTHLYNWKRFWCPRSGTVSLDFGGYLCDPESEWGRTRNTNLVTLTEISHFPCLVLLGEPGIGKTTTLKQEYENLKNRVKDSENTFLWKNLGDYDSDSNLCTAIFGNPTFQDWLQGNHTLYIFLDSLDEGRLSIKNIVRILKRKIEYLACDRLYFRITCRTYDWAYSLEDKLKEKWGEDNVKIYNLAPLRRIDVIEAVKEKEIDAEKFLQEVFDKNATPLAIKPVTLKFLLGIFQKKGEFPNSQKELYKQGCLQLCEEVNRDRCEEKITGNLSTKQRLIITGRIAALTLFANRSAIWISSEYGEMPSSDLAIQDLCGGKESIDGQEFLIDQACIEEVLSITGLFSSHGGHRMGWAHQTYAEFLAAWYLKQRQLNFPQILKLIVHSGDPDNRIVPQLHETVAWLAGMIPEVFGEVMKTDPDILLQSDIATADEADKEALVECLLKLLDKEKLPYPIPYFNSPYKHLNHSKIANQLQPYISDATKTMDSRMVAIDIARVCEVKDVQNYLVQIALDSQQPSPVRINAAQTISSIGDDSTKAKLKPLAIVNPQNKEEEELKGYALQSVWPNHITVNELLDTLNQPKSNVIGGAYQDFVAHNIGEHLQSSDLPQTLAWLEKQPTRGDLHFPFNSLSDAIMLKAWEHLNETEILEGFARIAHSRIENYDYIIEKPNYSNQISFNSLLRENESKRYRLIEQIILSIPDSETSPFWLIGDSQYTNKMLFEEDLEWLIERLQASENKDKQEIYAELILQIFIIILKKSKGYKFEPVNNILEASQKNHILYKKFAVLGWIKPIELKIKEDYLKWHQEPKQNDTEPLLEPPPKQRVIEALQKVEKEQPELWWQVCMALTLTPTSTHWHFPNQPDLTKLPGWQEAETNTRAKIITTAKAYLETGQPEAEILSKKYELSCVSFAGYQALYVLAKHDAEFIKNLPLNIWKKWIPAVLKVLDLPYGNTGEKDEYCQIIVRAAYQSILDEFIETLIFLMIQKDYKPRTDYTTDVYRLVKNILNEPLSQIILRRVETDNLQAGMLEILLKDFFIQDVEQAKAFTKSFLSLPVPESGEARERAIVAAQMLLLYPDNSSWLVVWSAIQQDCDFGRQVLESIAFQSAYQGQIEKEIKEEYIADLYIFLVQQYPEIEQPEIETKKLKGIEAQILTNTDMVRRWKNYIPQRLQERGTPEACEALRKIIRELPELKEELLSRFLRTEALARRQTWQPLQPEEILKIVGCFQPTQNTDPCYGKLEEIHNKNKPMLDQPKYNFPNAQKVQIFERVETYIENNNHLDTNRQDVLDDLKQMVVNWQQSNPQATQEQATAIIEAEFKEIRNSNPKRWYQFLSIKRLFNGFKKSSLNVSEHFAEESLWGKAIIGFFEGVTDDIE